MAPMSQSAIRNPQSAIGHIRVALALAAVLLGVTPGAGQPPAGGPDRLVYRSPRGVTFEVTAAGLSAIRHRGREVARGGWSVFNAEGWFKDAGSGQVDAAKPGAQSIRVLNDHRASVRHVRGDVTCTADYDFAG